MCTSWRKRQRMFLRIVWWIWALVVGRLGKVRKGHMRKPLSLMTYIQSKSSQELFQKTQRRNWQIAKSFSNLWKVLYEKELLLVTCHCHFPLPHPTPTMFKLCWVKRHKKSIIYLYSRSKWVNPFPNTPFWDRSKFKEATDDNRNAAIKGFQDTDSIENIVEKGEIAHLTFFHNVFLKAFFFNVLKWVYMEKRVKRQYALTFLIYGTEIVGVKVGP